jgi:hypothetical protein
MIREDRSFGIDRRRQDVGRVAGCVGWFGRPVACARPGLGERVPTRGSRRVGLAERVAEEIARRAAGVTGEDQVENGGAQEGE